MKMPRSKSRRIAFSVIHVISSGALKCVCSTTSLPHLAPALDDGGERVEPLLSVMSFIGMIAGPLVAKRMRRRCGMSSSALPISSMFLGASWYTSPPEITMSSSSGRHADVLERLLPLLGRLGQRDLVDVFRVGADRVAARAEAAVDRAGVQRQKERFVDVPVHEARNRRVFLLVQRVERQPRMVGQQRRGQRDELPANRVVDRIAPIDERDGVG